METVQAVQRYALGTILTLRMPGHSRTNGAEYYAPAIVLSQHPVTQTGGGEIEVIIFDSTSGTSYQHAYAVRELGTHEEIVEVPVAGSDPPVTTPVPQRVYYEVRSNVGEVLFDPAITASVTERIEILEGMLALMRQSQLAVEVGNRLEALEARAAALEAAVTAPPVPKAKSER